MILDLSLIPLAVICLDANDAELKNLHKIELKRHNDT